MTEQQLKDLIELIEKIKYGKVEIKIHEGKVTLIERLDKEKIKY